MLTIWLDIYISGRLWYLIVNIGHKLGGISIATEYSYYNSEANECFVMATRAVTFCRVNKPSPATAHFRLLMLSSTLHCFAMLHFGPLFVLN